MSSTTRTSTSVRGTPTLCSRSRHRGWFRSRVVCLGQGGDRHRRLALPVDLGQPGAEDGEGVLQVGQVHRCAAIDDGLQVGEVGGGDGPVAGQPLHHGGSGEERHSRPAPQQGGDLVAVDTAGLRHDAHRPAGDVGQPVEPRTVRQRRSVEDAVLRHHRVDVGEVAERRHEQVAVRERGSLGLSGGAARVEQPRRVLRQPADERRRRRRRQAGPTARRAPPSPPAAKGRCRPVTRHRRHGRRRSRRRPTRCGRGCRRSRRGGGGR